MALLNSEIVRIRYELGFSTLSSGAEPYIGIAAVFNQVVQVYAGAGAVTTSSTSATASTSPAPVTLTLASAVGFSAFDNIVVDVDARQEVGTVQSVSGSTVTVLLTNAHSGSYPVTVEGSESIIRSILRKLVAIDGPNGAIAQAVSTAGIKKADEVEFFPSGSGSSKSRIEQVQEYREYLRAELYRAIFGQGGGSLSSRVALY